MRTIYKNIRVKIPPGAKISYTDKRVYVDRFDPDSKKIKRIKIGEYIEPGLMHPNDNFRQLYPKDFEAAGGKLSIADEATLKAGMYALTLGLAHKTGLYQALVRALSVPDGAEEGAFMANKFLDLAVCSIISNDNAAMKFPEAMSGYVLFSGDKPMSDSTIGELYNEEMTEAMSLRFRELWLDECLARGVNNAWIAVDGSNSDCKAKAVELACPGKSKSGNNVPVVSYLCAVTAPGGMPLTYSVHYGSVPDASAWQPMCARLIARDVTVNGFIFDRGFLFHDTVLSMEEGNYTYVAMMRSDLHGYKQMHERYAREIYWNPEYLIGRNSFYGVTERCKLFGSHPEEANVSLYYDAESGCDCSRTVNRKLFDARQDALDKISSGRKPVIPPELSRYIKAEDSGAGSYTLKIDYGYWKDEPFRHGYSAIATNAELDAAAVNEIYRLRDASEKGFSTLKTQLGYDALRGHYTEGIQSRLDAGFIASILRAAILNACRSQGIEDTNVLIREMGRVRFELVNGSYCFIDKLSTRQAAVLKEAGIGKDELVELAKRLNERSGDSSAYHRMHDMPGKGWPEPHQDAEPEQTEAPEPQQPESEPAVKKHAGGRPKGRKNNKTLEREQYNREHGIVPPSPPGRGRKKGSKNKKTLAREEYERLHPAPPAKIGRPKGSKNKKTLEREAQAAEEARKQREEMMARTAGRPAGSKNQSTLEREAAAAAKEHGPGRPKGRKNQKTLEREQEEERKLRNAIRAEKRRAKKIAEAAAQQTEQEQITGGSG